MNRCTPTTEVTKLRDEVEFSCDSCLLRLFSTGSLAEAVRDSSSVFPSRQVSCEVDFGCLCKIHVCLLYQNSQFTLS